MATTCESVYPDREGIPSLGALNFVFGNLSPLLSRVAWPSACEYCACSRPWERFLLLHFGTQACPRQLLSRRAGSTLRKSDETIIPNLGNKAEEVDMIAQRSDVRTSERQG
jgi:hypothetical protein